MAVLIRRSEYQEIFDSLLMRRTSIRSIENRAVHLAKCVVSVRLAIGLLELVGLDLHENLTAPVHAPWLLAVPTIILTHSIHFVPDADLEVVAILRRSVPSISISTYAVTLVQRHFHQRLKRPHIEALNDATETKNDCTLGIDTSAGVLHLPQLIEVSQNFMSVALLICGVGYKRLAHRAVETTQRIGAPSLEREIGLQRPARSRIAAQVFDVQLLGTLDREATDAIKHFAAPR